MKADNHVQSDADDMRTIAMAYEPDRYLAALLAPRSSRNDLIALAAFLSELRKIADQVSDPMIGEIRIQWWRDVIEAAPRGQLTGHPIADAFATVIERYDLPQNQLFDVLDAHAHQLYSASPSDEDAFNHELELTEGIAFTLASRILGCVENDVTLRAIALASHAYGRARVGLSLPMSLARGRFPLPRQNDMKSDDETDDITKYMRQLCSHAAQSLQDFRAIMATMSKDRKALTTALLPVAVTEPYLKALQRADHNPARDIAEIAPLKRVWRLRSAHASGRI
ncbi:MAG: squalene synthase [Hyphomicrobium sp.]|nr:MAG: squalene synthase [Hyphomicrobium sp.]